MRWMIRFAMTSFYPSVDGLPGIAETDLDGFLIMLRRDAAPTFYLGVKLAAIVFVWLPILTTGWPLPAFMMPKSWRDGYARRFSAHPFYLMRQLSLIIKTTAGMCWGADPKVREVLGMAPYPADPGTFRGDEPEVSA